MMDGFFHAGAADDDHQNTRGQSNDRGFYADHTMEHKAENDEENHHQALFEELFVFDGFLFIKG
ncbi:hypothetical protein DSECCO2_659170 [anaerobic digester metagenome]